MKACRWIPCLEWHHQQQLCRQALGSLACTHFCAAQVRAAKQAVAAGSLSSKNILRPGKRQPKRVLTGEEGEEDDDDEPGGAHGMSPQHQRSDHSSRPVFPFVVKFPFA